jgi:site-specific DNA recombinase
MPTTPRPRAATVVDEWPAVIYTRVSADKRGDERSCDEQEADARKVVDSHARDVPPWRLHGKGVWSDNDIGASKFSRTKQRPEWENLLKVLESGQVRVLVVWEPSRATRDLAVWAALIDVCERNNVLMNVNGRTYDPSDPDEQLVLNMFFCMAVYEVAKTRKRVNRAVAAGVSEGRPGTRCPIGYRRRYNDRTGTLEAQEPDPDTAEVVRWIFGQFTAGTPLNSIVTALNKDLVQPPKGKRNDSVVSQSRWYGGTVRKILTNRTYIGRRVYKGQDVGEGQWDPIVDEDTFWAAQRILGEPERKTYRPGRSHTLLGFILRCGKCGQKMAGRNNRKRADGTRYSSYECVSSCTGIKMPETDATIIELVVRYLSDPTVYEGLTSPDDRDLVQARADLEEIRAEMDQLVVEVKQGMSVALAAAADEALRARLTEAEERFRTVALPPVIRPVVGPIAKDQWFKLDAEIQREIVRTLMDIVVRPVGRRGWSAPAYDPERLQITWKLTPQPADETPIG